MPKDLTTTTPNKQALLHAVSTLLALIEQDKVLNLAIAAELTNGETLTTLAGREGNKFHLLGAVTHLAHRINNEAIEPTRRRCP